MRKYLRIHEQLVYENSRVQVFDDKVITPDGGPGTYFRFRYKSGRAGVVIIPRTPNGFFGVIGVYRYAFDEHSIEFPRGNVKQLEKPTDAARRELKEEIGIIVPKMTAIGVLRPDTSIAEVEAHVFLAELPIGAESQAVAEGSEALSEVKFLTYEEICGSIRRGTIRDAFTIGAITLLALYKPS